MDVTVKASGLTITDGKHVSQVKAGNVAVTVTATDGGKKSKQMKFKISNADELYGINVLMQDASDYSVDLYVSSFLNATNTEDPMHGWGL